MSRRRASLGTSAFDSFDAHCGRDVEELWSRMAIIARHVGPCRPRQDPAGGEIRFGQGLRTVGGGSFESGLRDSCRAPGMVILGGVDLTC
jgi:hypothetical protein